jgi:integrase
MITIIGLKAPWRGKKRWLSDGGSRNGGRLVARVSRNATDFLFQYFDDAGRKRFLPIGPFDAAGERGLTLPTARDRAAELSALYLSGVHELHGHFERLRTEEKQARAAAQKAEDDARAQAQHGTLAQLLSTYTEHLARLGKSSVKDVRNIFKNHVLTGHAALVSRKANAVGVDEWVEVIGQVVAAGHGRTAAKLRSYLRAAYALAIEAKTDPAAPAILKTFGISTNPLASIGALSQFNRTRHRHLAAPELGALLRRLDCAPASAQTDALEVAIELGGQRPTQLLRLRAGDVDLVGGTITLYDPKGARSEPRVHVIPLPPRALGILARRLAALSGGPQCPGLQYRWGDADATRDGVGVGV